MPSATTIAETLGDRGSLVAMSRDPVVAFRPNRASISTPVQMPRPSTRDFREPNAVAPTVRLSPTT